MFVKPEKIQTETRPRVRTPMPQYPRNRALNPTDTGWFSIRKAAVLHALVDVGAPDFRPRFLIASRKEGLLYAPPYHERSTGGHQVLIPTRWSEVGILELISGDREIHSLLIGAVPIRERTGLDVVDQIGPAHGVCPEVGEDSLYCNFVFRWTALSTVV